MAAQVGKDSLFRDDDPPTIFILKTILRRACSDQQRQILDNGQRANISPLSEVIFRELPKADTGAVQALLCTSSGLEDFTRVNAHHRRRKIHPNLSNDRLKKRSCLYCLTTFSEIVEDTEWHAFFECQCFTSARNQFCFSTKRVLNCANPCTVDDLCSLVTAVADNEESAGELARFALSIRSTRRHLFRQLSSDGPSGRALVAARSAALLL